MLDIFDSFCRLVCVQPQDQPTHDSLDELERERFCIAEIPEVTNRKCTLFGTQNSLNISARADYYVVENGGLEVVMKAMDLWKGM